MVAAGGGQWRRGPSQRAQWFHPSIQARICPKPTLGEWVRCTRLPWAPLGCQPVRNSPPAAAEETVAWILPFTSGGFLYIALVNVLPDLLEEDDPW